MCVALSKEDEEQASDVCTGADFPSGCVLMACLVPRGLVLFLPLHLCGTSTADTEVATCSQGPGGGALLSPHALH